MVNPGNFDALNQALLAATPVTAIAKYGKHEPLQESGNRFAVASNGLFVEVARPWLYALWPVAEQFPVPFGAAHPVIKLRCGHIPAALLDMFEWQAKQAYPNETAGWITYNEHSKQFTYRPLKETRANRARVSYETPVLEEGEHLVLDLHSHGDFAAHFSAQDDMDDYGAYKVSAVLGRVGSDQQEWCVRLCMGGVFIQMEQGLSVILGKSNSMSVSV